MLFFLAVGFFGSGFGALAYYLVSEANRYKNYLSFTGKVIHTCTKGSHFAVIQSVDPHIAQFEFCCLMAGLALLLIILKILFPDLIGSSGSFAL